jgi:hypothetical protein
MQAMPVILKKKDLTIDAEKFHLPSDCCVTDFGRFGGSEHSLVQSTGADDDQPTRARQQYASGLQGIGKTGSPRRQ